MWKRKKKVVRENPFQDKVAGKIAGAFMWMQTKFGEGMSKAVGHMKAEQLKLLVILFAVMSGGLSIYFVIDALVSKPMPALQIDPVRVPKHFDKSGDEVMDDVMPDDIYDDIQSYRRYMDSIGEPIRSGLQDSMRMLEKMYLQERSRKPNY